MSRPTAIIILLAAPYLFAFALIDPLINQPFHDYWTYAWSVDHFLKTGLLQVLDWSIHYPFAQVLWASLFALPFGFSFSLLKLSTVVLAWLGALAVYGTLRELGRNQGDSLVATLILVVNPVFFVLSFSFMTDVPFISIANIAFFFFVRGFCRKTLSQVWLGCGLAICAFFTRQFAVAIPASVLLYILFTPAYRSWKYIFPPIATILIFCLVPIVFSMFLGLTSQYTARTWLIDLWLQYYNLVLTGMLRVFIHIGLALAPLGPMAFAYSGSRKLLWASGGILLLLTGLSEWLSSGMPEPLDGMWSLRTFGKGRALLHRAAELNVLPSWLNYPLFAVAIVASSAIFGKVLEGSRKENGKPISLFAWYALIHFVLMIALRLFDAWGSDRYSLVLLPPLIMIISSGRVKHSVSIAGIVVLFTVSMLLTWNETQTSRYTYEALMWLRQKNIPIASIDAGYVLNGWNLYAHPENLRAGADRRRDVPFVTSKEKQPYVIASSPIPGYEILLEYSWQPLFLPTTFSIYALKRTTADAVGESQR